MPSPRRVSRSLVVALAALGAGAVLAACSSSGSTAGSGSIGSGGSTSSSGSTPGGGSTTGKASSPAAGASTPAPSTAAAGSAAAGASGLAYRLHRAVAGLTSDHLVFATTSAGQTIAGTADQKLSGGVTVAYRLTESLPQGGSLTLIKAGGHTYAKLPNGSSDGKPYVLLSTTSSDAQVRSLAQGLQSTDSAQSLQTTGVFISSARSVRDVGPATVGGVRATRYAIVIDPSKLPASFPDKAAIVSSGLTAIPLDLYVDGSDRPVRTVEHLTVGGRTVSSTTVLSRFDAPVSITAPPAGQVSTR